MPYIFWRGTRPFCQWHTIAFSGDGRDYNRAGQFMTTSKARLFGDPKAEARIVAAEDPGKHSREPLQL